MPDCSHPCGGNCCRGFVMSSTPERLGELYLEAKTYDLSDDDSASEYWRDVITIVEMLVRLDEEPDEVIEYTCTHFDDATGRCTIYERRPKMCREYPYAGGTCGKCGYSPPAPEPALVQIETKATVAA